MERLTFTPIESSKNRFMESSFNLNIVEKVVAPFTGNTIMFAITESNNEVAIKRCVYGSAEKEWSGLLKTSEHKIPVPVPVALVLDEESGEKLVITERYYGRSLYYFPDPEINLKFGEIVRSMHKITADGLEWDNSGKADFSYYDKYLYRWAGRSNTLIDNSMPNDILALLADEAQERSVNVVPKFTHQDLHDGQVFIISDDEIILTDFETWKEADTLEDLAIYLFHSVRTDRASENVGAFMEGYFRYASLFSKDRSTIAFYLLFIARRAVDYFAKYRKDYLEVAKDNLNKIVKYIDDERLWIDF